MGAIWFCKLLGGVLAGERYAAAQGTITNFYGISLGMVYHRNGSKNFTEILLAYRTTSVMGIESSVFASV